MTFVNVSCFKGSYLSFSFLQYVMPPGGNVFDRSYSFIAFSLFCRGLISVIFSNSDHNFKEDVLRFLYR